MVKKPLVVVNGEEFDIGQQLRNLKLRNVVWTFIFLPLKRFMDMLFNVRLEPFECNSCAIYRVF